MRMHPLLNTEYWILNTVRRVFSIQYSVFSAAVAFN